MKLKFLFFIITPINIYAQDNTAVLQTYFSEVQVGSYEPVPQSILNEEAQANELLTTLVTYQNDSNSVIRTRAYNISKRLGQSHPKIEIRQQAIDQQITALDDADDGIKIKAITALKGFKNTDFTNEQQLNIINKLNADITYLEAYALLVGFMSNETALGPLNQVLSQTTDGWKRFNLQAALARRGDSQAITAVLEKIKSAPINDGFIYDIVPLLVYTRSAKVFKFLEQIIFSEEANCASANPGSDAKILCGYRVMEYIAPAIQDFPIPTDEYGELIVDDYETALLTLREWLIQNPDIELVKDTY